MANLTNFELAVRLGAFGIVFLLMALWEALAPCRPRALPRRIRWRSNLSVVVFNSLLLRLFFPLALSAVAAVAANRDWGLFNSAVTPPSWLAVGISVVVLDAAVYSQHVAFHYVPLFWRFHRMHHADLDLDVTTGTRFHPGEMLLSQVIKAAAVLLLGAPLLAVLLFELILNGMAMFNHANVTLPRTVDRVLRYVVVTPDMHRVHHSVTDEEHNRNFGFNLSCWDRLFRTYRQQAKGGNRGMTIGLNAYRDGRQADGFWNMLKMPFGSR